MSMPPPPPAVLTAPALNGIADGTELFLTVVETFLSCPVGLSTPYSRHTDPIVLPISRMVTQNTAWKRRRSCMHDTKLHRGSSCLVEA